MTARASWALYEDLDRVAELRWGLQHRRALATTTLDVKVIRRPACLMDKPIRGEAARNERRRPSGHSKVASRQSASRQVVGLGEPWAFHDDFDLRFVSGLVVVRT